MFTPTVLDLCEDVVPRNSSRGDITAGVRGSRVTQRTQTSAVLGWAELGWHRIMGTPVANNFLLIRPRLDV